MNTKVKFSLIMLNRNGMKYLPVFFESLFAELDRDDVELIIYDNNSSDESLAYIAKHENKGIPIIVIKNDKNDSFSRANNLASKKAKGDYLVFVNNDIEFTRGWAEILDGYTEVYDEQKLGAIGSKLLYPKDAEDIGGKIQHFGIKFVRDPEMNYCKPYNYAQKEDPSKYGDDQEFAAVTAAFMIIKKDLFEEFGGFDEKYYYTYEDVDLCLRLHFAGYKNIVANSLVLYHWESATQKKYRVGKHEQRIKESMVYFKDVWEDRLNAHVFANIKESNKLYSDKSLLEFVEESEKLLLEEQDKSILYWNEIEKKDKDRETAVYIPTSLSKETVAKINGIAFALLSPRKFIAKYRSKD